MSREEFMKQLESLLSDVSEEEKKEALEYYRCYFEDAGEENEERILKELESPEKVARTIMADLEMGKDTSEESGTYTERGYQDERFSEKQEMGFHDNTAQNTSEQSSFEQNNFTEQNNENTSKTAEQNNDKAGKILLIVIIAVLTSPIWVGIAGGLFGGALGLAGGLFGILIAAIAAAGGLYIAGATLFGVGIAQLVVGNIPTGIALMGAAFLVLALAILATVACVWLYGRFLPWLVRGMITLCRRVFSGKGRAE